MLENKNGQSYYQKSIFWNQFFGWKITFIFVSVFVQYFVSVKSSHTRWKMCKKRLKSGLMKWYYNTSMYGEKWFSLCVPFWFYLCICFVYNALYAFTYTYIYIILHNSYSLCSRHHCQYIFRVRIEKNWLWHFKSVKIFLLICKKILHFWFLHFRFLHFSKCQSKATQPIGTQLKACSNCNLKVVIGWYVIVNVNFRVQRNIRKCWF